MIIKQYIPRYMNDRPESIYFDTLDELFSIGFVKSYENIGFTEKSFHRFSLFGNFLMAEYNDGDYWYTVGEIDFVSNLELPKTEWKY